MPVVDPSLLAMVKQLCLNHQVIEVGCQIGMLFEPRIVLNIIIIQSTYYRSQCHKRDCSSITVSSQPVFIEGFVIPAGVVRCARHRHTATPHPH